jgi:hypothetical protein
MKTVASLLGIFLLLTFGGCRYDDGGGLMSPTQRLSGTWRVSSVTRNGTDVTSSYLQDNYLETYEPDGIYSFSSIPQSGSGKWQWTDRHRVVSRFGIDGQPSRDLIILRLKSRQLWYYYLDGNDQVEFHMVPE